MRAKEQRRDPRVDIHQSVWVEGQDLRVEGEARNMSKRGMFVVAPREAPAVGTTLEIRFDDPQEGRIALQMEVIWRDPTTAATKLGLRTLGSVGTAAFERVVSRYLSAQRTPSASADEDGAKKH